MIQWIKKLSCALVCLSGVMLSAPAQVEAQAFCALRDPVRLIFDLFPEGTSYRSVVEEIGLEEEKKISSVVPFTIHKKEFGQHSVYAVFKDTGLIGVVHARSELGKWGLMEIVWAFESDLNTFRDITFQRCREVGKEVILSDTFKKQMMGKTKDELVALLTEDGLSLRPDAIEIEEEAKDLAVSVIRSSIKTMLLTDIVYRNDIEALK